MEIKVIDASKVQNVFSNFTKEEFLESEYMDECPIEYELPVLPICQEGADEEECKKCWVNAIKNVEFKNPVELFKEANVTVLDELRIMEEQYKMIATGRDKLKEKLLQQMEFYGIDKFENDNMSITYVKGSTGTKFNSSKFKKEYPDIYQEYCEPTVRSASIRFKVK